MDFPGSALTVDDDDDDEGFTVVQSATFSFFVDVETIEAGDDRFFDEDLAGLKLGTSGAPCLAVLRTPSS